jgi:hypothetical protein
MPECDPLATPADPTRPAAITGAVEIFDYDFWDEQRSMRDRVRNAGVNFYTNNLPVQPTSEGALYRGIAQDTCIAVDVPAPRTPLGPSRNIGTELLMRDETGIVLRRPRKSDQDGVHYRDFASQEQLLMFFDPLVTDTSRGWTWSSPGDPSASIRAFEATVGPVEDFEVTPAITSTGAPLQIEASGFTISWTAPVATPADVSIVLGRAIGVQGDGRYLICRPIDDGSFTVPPDAIATFGPVPGLAFDLVVSRAQVAAFCNEGVPAGVAHHATVYLGAGVLP